MILDAVQRSPVQVKPLLVCASQSLIKKYPLFRALKIDETLRTLAFIYLKHQAKFPCGFFTKVRKIFKLFDPHCIISLNIHLGLVKLQDHLTTDWFIRFLLYFLRLTNVHCGVEHRSLSQQAYVWVVPFKPIVPRFLIFWEVKSYLFTRFGPANCFECLRAYQVFFPVTDVLLFSLANYIG